MNVITTGRFQVVALVALLRLRLCDFIGISLGLHLRPFMNHCPVGTSLL